MTAKDFAQHNFEGAWHSFEPGKWSNDEVDVRDFIQRNYTPYEGDGAFLAPATEATKKLWEIVMDYSRKERERGGVYDADTSIVSTVASHKAGYFDKSLEKIVGLQTDMPFKRSLQPFGGIRMAEEALEMYGYHIDPEVKYIFTHYRKTHNDGVYDAYTPEMRRARSAHILTGLPDTYGRGRIVGDYRRVALYGVDYLIQKREEDKSRIDGDMTPDRIRDREEVAEQVKALKALKAMAAEYGFDISRPAENAQEAIQWLYFGYLAAVKDQNGAAMTIGRNSTFLDIYIERDLRRRETHRRGGAGACRSLRHEAARRQVHAHQGIQRTVQRRSYLGHRVHRRHGRGRQDARHQEQLPHPAHAQKPRPRARTQPHGALVAKAARRLQDASAPRVSIETSAIQYESDDLMRPEMGDDYCIACCVSSMRVGKDMQFFGARANLAKCLLYAINGGKDELMKDKKTGKPMQVSPAYAPILGDGPLDFSEVMRKYEQMMRVARAPLCQHAQSSSTICTTSTATKRSKWRCTTCRCAASSQRASRASPARRTAFPPSEYAKVYPVRNEDGIVTDFQDRGRLSQVRQQRRPGGRDRRVARQDVHELHQVRTTYRESVPTMSILTITSNVVYGKKTGNTPDGRRAGEPLAPGANPMHGRDSHGALASLESVAKLPYDYARDGISNTFSVTPQSLGKDED